MKIHALSIPLVLASIAGAQTQPVSPTQTRLVAFTTSFDPGVEATAHVQLSGAPGASYVLLGAPHQELGFYASHATLVGQGVLDAQGQASHSWPLFDLALLPQGAAFDYLAVMNGGALQGTGKKGQANRFSNKGVMALGSPVHCQVLDFDFTIGPVEPEAGQVLSGDWADIGLHISAENNVAGHPDKAIVFDSSNPTGEDPDLATPGYGPGNDEPLGNLLIVAEDDVDLDLDGFVDDPDDETGGGWLNFDFDEPVTLCSTQILDIDDQGPTRVLVSFADGSPQAVLFVPNGGDNSVQWISLHYTGVSRLQFAFSGSGAIADVRFEPCPSVLSFDETMTGEPINLRAGTVMTDQFVEGLGLSISALNNFDFPSAHPDKALIFDTALPTGGDTDLATPGYGTGNDTALGKVLIIAENDVDADLDGFVDDPDDEAIGGVLRFDFDGPVLFLGGTVVDIDSTEGAYFSLRDENDVEIGTLPVVSMGDNSVQVVEPEGAPVGVRAVELHLSGSGALARLRWCPVTSTSAW
jgi:hypothetical protein